MKTRYSRRTHSLSPLAALGLGVAVVILLMGFLLRVVFPGALVALSAPLFSFGTYLSGIIQLPGNSAALTARVADLEQQNKTLAEENATLAKRLGDQGETTGIIAGVIARPPQSPYDALIIGAGTNDGVGAGMRVEVSGVPVGSVESATAQSARVALSSSPGRDTEGWIGKSNVPVTLHGEGAGAFSADIPKDAPVVEGDMVYVPGPGALPVGTVTKIITEASSPRAVLHIRPSINPFTTTWVSIVPL